MDPPATSDARVGDEDEWELAKDEDFVYKRKKRRRESEDPSSSAVAGESAVVDAEAEKRYQRAWKWRLMTNLKRKYETEIERWGALSKGVREMEEKASRFEERRREQGREAEETASLLECDQRGAQGSDRKGSSILLDELLVLVTTQEGVIHDVSHLCDVAETICDAREEQLKQPYFDLPVWRSPKELMALLCSDEMVENLK